jgi:hypothetical protein
MEGLEGLEQKPTQTEAWHLQAPDWRAKDTIRRSKDPFILWEVGDQPLLAHWFDEAFNRGYTEVVVHVADRPAEVRRFAEQASLWPMEITIQSEPRVERERGWIIMNRLPWEDHISTEPSYGWELVDYWAELEKRWFQHNEVHLKEAQTYLSVGRHCQIHPSVKLNEPYWIGDQVSIGPGCVIGPYACIGDRCLLAGGSDVRNAKIFRNTYLSPDTELVDAYLEGPQLFNRRHRAVVDRLDSVIAGEVVERATRVSMGHRLRAWFLQSQYRDLAEKAIKENGLERVTTLGGQVCELTHSENPFIARWPMYRRVIRGELPLIGVPPYAQESLVEVNEEWQDILRQAQLGIFGLSDVNCQPGAEIEERILHDIYQASSDSPEAIDTIVSNYIRKHKSRPRGGGEAA